MPAREHCKRHPSLTALEASRDCLYRGDVHFFILTEGGKKEGVMRELNIAATEAGMADKAEYCVIFDQISDNHSSISTMWTDIIRNAGIARRDFAGEGELRRALLQEAALCLRMMSGRLRRRQSGAWGAPGRGDS